MKMNIAPSFIWTVCLFGLASYGQSPVFAQTTNAVADNTQYRSIFVLPKSRAEGCDPFYPDSNRPYDTFAPPVKKSFEMSALAIHGISGTGNNRFVIINTHTFAEGDEEDVPTSVGRVHLRCIEIKPNSAIVEVNGQQHELIYSGK